MALSIARWRPRHLLLAWVTYWIALVLVTLGEPLGMLWRIAQAPKGQLSSVSVSVANWVCTLKITEGAHTAWLGSADLGAIALWVGVPPLLLWMAWLRRRAPAPVVAEHAARPT